MAKFSAQAEMMSGLIVSPLVRLPKTALFFAKSLSKKNAPLPSTREKNAASFAPMEVSDPELSETIRLREFEAL